MDRRNALKYTSSVLGVTLIGASAFLNGCITSKQNQIILSADDVLLLDEIGETILPESDRSPGAKAAHIGEFMNIIVKDCYAPDEQKIFVAGLQTVREASQLKYKKGFIQITHLERLQLLTDFDQQSRSAIPEGPLHFFTMMKQLTIWGYFSSEPGVTKAMRYDPMPGGYNGCVDYKDGDKAWYGPLSSIG